MSDAKEEEKKKNEGMAETIVNYEIDIADAEKWIGKHIPFIGDFKTSHELILAVAELDTAIVHLDAVCDSLLDSTKDGA